MNVFFVPLLKVDCVVITDLLDERVLVGETFAEKFYYLCIGFSLCVLRDTSGREVSVVLIFNTY
jgi:hypothetical protein